MRALLELQDTELTAQVDWIRIAASLLADRMSTLLIVT